MNTLGRTIQIYLPNGDPSGIRVAEITTSILRVIEIPRNQFGFFLNMPEASQVGVYFLFSEDGENSEKMLYVGQSGDLKTRLSSHHKKKDSWNKVVVVLSLTNNMTQTHALYLEWLALERAQQAGRYPLENANAGSKPHTPSPLTSDCELYFELMNLLISTLGYPVFKPLTDKNDEVFYCTRNEVRGKGSFTDEGFVIHKGSIGAGSVTQEENGRRTRIRNKLLESGEVKIENGQMIFLKDVLFKSPSGASGILLGRSSNGWVDWKNAARQTLDEVKRGALIPEECA